MRAGGIKSSGKLCTFPIKGGNSSSANDYCMSTNTMSVMCRLFTGNLNSFLSPFCQLICLSADMAISSGNWRLHSEIAISYFYPDSQGFLISLL